MVKVGIRELNARTSEILRQVREQSVAVTVTYRGRAVARIVPLTDTEAKEIEASAFLTQIGDLAKEIGAHWPPGVSALEAVTEQRRESSIGYDP